MGAKKKSDIIQTTGTKKRAVARAVLKPGKGVVRINSLLLKEYGNELSRMRIAEPIKLAGDLSKKYNIDVDVRGGGWQGQTGAIRLAIARALAKVDEKLKKLFLSYDRELVVADVRIKETRKPNKSKARAKRQKSYR